MITSKQRAYLRALANPIEALYQVGKEGVGENVLAQLNEALEKRELIKVSLLNNSGLDTRETLSEICEKLGAEPVSAIGFKMVLYRQAKNKDLRKIILPKK